MRWISWVCIAFGAATLAPTAAQGEGRQETRMIHWLAGQAQVAAEQGEPQIAESRYRTVLRESWNLLGLLAVAEGDDPSAHQAFERSFRASVEGVGEPRQHLALTQYHLGESASALRHLRALTRQMHSDPPALGAPDSHSGRRRAMG